LAIARGERALFLLLFWNYPWTFTINGEFWGVNGSKEEK
jgi:hypothetical protein